jgi:ATP-dependent RNA helicase SUPV3L1/SUV3
VHWQQRTREIEDRLSDALHERLTERFVDRRAAVIARASPEGLIVEVDAQGQVLVQGLPAGRLEGFRFAPDPSARNSARGLIAAANKALRADIGTRVSRFAEEPDEAFALRESGDIAFRGGAVGRALAGDDPLAPRVEALASELLDPPQKEKVRRRLAAWLDAHLRRELGALFALREAPLKGAARGLAFALAQSLGTLPRRRVAPQLAGLQPADRRALARLHVVIGREAVYVGPLVGRGSTALRAQLWGIQHGSVLSPPSERSPSVPQGRGVPPDFYLANGFVPIAGRAVRAERLERALALAYRHAGPDPFAPGPEIASLLGCRVPDVLPLLRAAGYAPRGQRSPKPAANRAERRKHSAS